MTGTLCLVHRGTRGQVTAQTDQSSMNTETRLATYLKAAAVLLPAAFISFAAALFLTPKLEQISASAGVLPRGVDNVIYMSHLW